MATNTIIQAEEEFLASKSKKITVKKTSKSSLKGKKEVLQQDQQLIENGKEEYDEKQKGVVNDNNNTKKKTKKSKKSESISVKSSFSKFDSLEKGNATNDAKDNKSCHICLKPVYKMEEIKAVKNIFHKNCFRCAECNKLLNVDNYHSNEGIIYCAIHFKLLLGPRAVEETEQEPIKKPKPELIIRENEPLELPPDVVRASTKSDLGLAELQQLNLRSRFEMFEYPKKNEENFEQTVERKSSNTIRMKMAKFQNSEDNQEDENEEDDNDEESDDNMSLIEIPQRERPIGIGTAMQDIREKFEKGPLTGKNDRREECKQEIQNIRSRLFTGKQARIKEMYQQAVAESEQSIISVGKLENIERSTDAQDIKERFEKGEFFKENAHNGNEFNGTTTTNNLQNDVEVFNSGISKKSRSIFMELDANILSEKQQKVVNKSTSNTNLQKRIQQNASDNKIPEATEIIKSDQLVEDVVIKTSDVSSKFKFFEGYRPNVHEKKQFRITPPREGVVKMPIPDSGSEDSEEQNIDVETAKKELLECSHTTAKMVNKFREIEENQRKPNKELNPKPLKRFTPPPDGNRRLYATANESDDYSDEDENESTPDDEDEELQTNKSILNDSSLKEAQAAARAKALRAKFEKWEASEIERESNEQRNINVYSKDVSDESNIESTKSIRERFERLQSEEKLRGPARPRYQVNRFK